MSGSFSLTSADSASFARLGPVVAEAAGLGALRAVPFVDCVLLAGRGRGGSRRILDSRQVRLLEGAGRTLDLCIGIAVFERAVDICDNIELHVRRWR